MHVHKIKKIGVVVWVFLKLHYIIHRPASCLFGRRGVVVFLFGFGLASCVCGYFFFLFPQGLKKTSEDGREQHLFHSPGP